MTIEALKQRLRAKIAATHGSVISASIARAARAYLNAYDNHFIWDIGRNGELAAFRMVASIAEGDVIDAGANIGQWAQAIRPYLSGKHLHCFEPIPQVFKELAANVEGEGIVTNNCALGAADGSVTLNYSATVSTISSTYPLIFPQKDSSSVDCHVTSGDEYLDQMSIGLVSFLKIDVEGMEMDVISGFSNALSEGRIGAVQFEHGPAIFTPDTI